MLAIDVTNQDTDLEEARAVAELINQQEDDAELQTKEEVLNIVFDVEMTVDEKMDRMNDFDVSYLNQLTLVDGEEIDSIEEFRPVLQQVEKMHDHPVFDLTGMATILNYVQFGKGTLEDAISARDNMRSIDMDMHVVLDASKIIDAN